MDMLSDYLSNKMEHITSSLYNHILSWAEKRVHSTNNPKQQLNGYCYCCSNNYYGLEALVHSEDQNLPQRIVHCYNKASTTTTTKSEPYSSLPLSKLLWSSSPPALRPTVLGELIGTESGDCMSSEVAEVQMEIAKMEGQSQSRFGRREMRSERKKEQELPPLITLMRKTGQMPWSFKKEYNEYGRLIVSVERVRRREYIEAHRENNRLTMKLVHVDDDDDDDNDENNTDCCEECGWPIDEEECFDEDEEESDFEFEFEQELEKESNMENESGRCMDLRKSVSYTSSGGLVRDSDSFWTGDATPYLGRRPSSAPLQPMTPVM